MYSAVGRQYTLATVSVMRGAAVSPATSTTASPPFHYAVALLVGFGRFALFVRMLSVLY